ncbi:major facilitator superfamily domain-containing protein [Fimicolochytrium jonesii]|uniref:major facilitator superfamily domain-containing protein n=1 Tax=Fimicolochytrium jonesii TaxID=1396493 RepID=UPI0022FDFF61|nr:major facilitator superfamily domain-containing protein [Fimicolochytrium jonesii]KAI8817473.1 major facilitator superfamily domain-containing protein [Fimicolochytrium jonesii]
MSPPPPQQQTEQQLHDTIAVPIPPAFEYPSDEKKHSENGPLPTTFTRRSSASTFVTVAGLPACLDDDDDSSSLPNNNTTPSSFTPPNGGLPAWGVVLGAFLFNFINFGMASMWGVYQAHYSKQQTFGPTTTQLQLSFVGGLGGGVTFVFGPIVGWVQRRWGFKAPLWIGTVVFAGSLELASLSTKLWHLYLTQSFLFGLGASLIFLGSVGAPPQWFHSRRALATGLAASGSGIGTLVLAPLAQHLIDTLEVFWCLRIMGLIALVGGVVGSLLCRLPDGMVVEEKSVDWSHVKKNTGFRWMLAFAVTNLLGYIIPFYFIPSYALSLGLSPSTGAFLVALLSGTNAFGRILAGQLADKIGRINAQSLVIFVSGLSCLTLWSTAHTQTTLTIFVVVYGITGGGYWALTPAVVAEIVGITALGGALPIVFMTNSLPMIFSGPIASAILGAQGGSYTGLIAFAGSALCVGALCLVPVKMARGRVWAKV